MHDGPLRYSLEVRPGDRHGGGGRRRRSSIDGRGTSCERCSGLLTRVWKLQYTVDQSCCLNQHRRPRPVRLLSAAVEKTNKPKN